MSTSSLAATRRALDPSFTRHYFTGRGIDLGPGPEPLAGFAGAFPGMTALDTAAWPPEHLEALPGLPNDNYDFVHSDLSLAIVDNCFAALQRWFEVVKPGGHLILRVPDEDLAGRGLYPTPLAPDWKWTFTIYKRRSWSAKSINLVNLIMTLGESAEIKRIVTLDGEMDYSAPIDFGTQPSGEAGIEVVIRKRRDQDVNLGGRLTPDPFIG